MEMAALTGGRGAAQGWRCQVAAPFGLRPRGHARRVMCHNCWAAAYGVRRDSRAVRLVEAVVHAAATRGLSLAVQRDGHRDRPVGSDGASPS